MSFPHVRGLPAPLASAARCLVMGVVNVTPDSFSDGGLWLRPDDAIRHGLELAASGADLVDVGGESTRPGATRVPEEEELRRVLPVVRGLASAGVAVSIDTMRAAVATQALGAGAVLVNDVSGGLADPAMAQVVAAAGVPYVVMHWRGHSDTMDAAAQYTDVVADVRGELSGRLTALQSAGVRADQLIVDPGLGFAKNAAHNWELLAGLSYLLDLGRPVLIAASRKRFLGSVLATGDQPADPRPPAERDAASAAVSALAAAAGAWCVRVHEVAASRDAVAVAAAWTAVSSRQPAGASR